MRHRTRQNLVTSPLRSTQGTVILAISLLLGSMAGAQSPCDTCQWAERGDRWEGVVAKEQISGGSFDLLSVQFRHRGDAVSGSSDLHLTFYLPEPLELDELRVWQPERLYSMEPLRKEYGADRQEFTWPRDEVVGRLGLATDSLYVLARDEGVFYPGWISDDEGSVPADGYAFVFKSGAGIDAMCTIARQGEHAGVVRRFECWEDVGGTIVVEWDGRDENGQALPRGVYVLTVAGDMLAETHRPLRRNVAFWHRGL